MKIIIVDDDYLVAASLRTIIGSADGFEVMALGANAEEACELYRMHHPDILLMDIRMGAATGLDAARQIIDEFPAANILFLTTFSDDEYIIDALKIGAKGYLLKQNYDCIVPALRAVEQGQSVFGAEIVSKFTKLDSFSKKSVRDFGLLEKELEIIALVADGLSNKEIAAAVFLSEGTVRNYISVILEKLNLRDRTQLAIFYLKNKEASH